MFGLAWTEIGLIAVVAMVLIGPKDMPVAIRGISDMIKKARRMAGEFQGHVDEMLRESGMEGVRDSITELRSMDLRGQVMRAVDSDGSIRSALTDDPFRHAPTSVTPPTDGWGAPIVPSPEGQVTFTATAPQGEAPAFVPPEYVPPRPPVVEVPAFVPPAAVHPGS